MNSKIFFKPKSIPCELTQLSGQSDAIMQDLERLYSIMKKNNN